MDIYLAELQAKKIYVLCALSCDSNHGHHANPEVEHDKDHLQRSLVRHYRYLKRWRKNSTGSSRLAQLVIPIRNQSRSSARSISPPPISNPLSASLPPHDILLSSTCTLPILAADRQTRTCVSVRRRVHRSRWWCEKRSIEG